MTRSASAELSEFSSDPESSQPGTNSQGDAERYGAEALQEGLASVIERGRILACMPLLGDKETAALVEAWYVAVINVIPARYWKEVGLWASRYTNPADKFTLRQFFEAWTKFCEQGRARGYETWR